MLRRDAAFGLTRHDYRIIKLIRYTELNWLFPGCAWTTQQPNEHMYQQATTEHNTSKKQETNDEERNQQL